MATYEEILSKFTIKSQTDKRADCICPNHADKKASLHITKGTDRTLINCKACGKGATEDILSRVGLEMKDLFYDTSNFKKTWKENLEGYFKKKIKDFYHYTDEKGNYCYTKVRFTDKDFRYGVIEQEETFFNMKATPKNETGKRVPLLYNVIDLINAKPGDTVYYVEGEKDVHTLKKMGLAATTAGGANDWNRKFVKYFKDLDVIILADNDTPGIESATTIKNNLKGIVKNVKLVIPSTREHGDITDFFEDGFTVDDLQALIEESAEKEICPDTKNIGASYIFTNNRGNLSINTSLLAEHIRQQSNYYIVKKQGSDSFFIYWYEDGYYKELSPNELKAKIKALIPLEIRKPTFWEDTYKDIIATDNFISYDKMNTDKFHINFQNGLLDTRTWEFKEHSPEYNHTYQIKCNYNPGAKEPTVWNQFIDTLTSSDREVHDTLQEWLGLNISNYNANICKKAVALSGAVGNTGKSKLLKVMARLIGVENVSSKPIQDLSARFGAGALYGKKCILIDDQKGTNIEDGSTFKAITGDGLIEVELKGKEPFSFEFRGGITFTCNSMPYIKDDKGSHMFQRFLIIPCNNVIPEDKRDKRIFEKMEDELEGIALWALEGLKRLLENNFSITEGQASKQANEEYRALNDTLFKFISESCITTGDNKDRIKKTEFETRYDKFCMDNGLSALDKKNIKDRAERNGILCKIYSGFQYYCGIKYKD